MKTTGGQSKKPKQQVIRTYMFCKYCQFHREHEFGIGSSTKPVGTTVKRSVSAGKVQSLDFLRFCNHLSNQNSGPVV